MGPQLRVLLLHDDRAATELVLSALAGGGLSVDADVAATMGALEERLGAGSYDVVLAAYRLKGWGGMDALSAVRARNPDVPFILVADSIGEERAVECLRAGATDCVFERSVAGLPEVVRHALEARRAHGQGHGAAGAPGGFEGEVAHDVNNALTVIMTYADLLIGRLGPDDPLTEDVREIRKAASHAAGLTRAPRSAPPRLTPPTIPPL